MINDLWYKDALIYNFSLDGFADGNGDGIGDFSGALRKLDYLQGLGVTTIWLAPFQPSPMKDHGYDITDYYGVDPSYGSLGDFVEFSAACRQRGLRLIIDLVINHCSVEHPWFKEAESSPDSPYYDYFIWADEKPANADEGIVFPGVQKSTWTYSRKAGKYYFHRFYKFQPDLNIANPAVQREMMKIIGFWLELGVSGFRMDAVPFLIAEEGINVKDPAPAYSMLRDIRALAQWRKGDAVLLAEANIEPDVAKEYFGEDGDRLHMLFNFPVNQALFYALASGDSLPLREKLEGSRGIPETAQWAHFLRNHDELDIGRLPDDQKAKVFAAFGPDEDMQLYDRGIRRRLAPMLGGDRQRLELAYSIMLTLPGTPVIRYGDEIGMGDDLSLPEREAARTPMQWSDGPQGGFTTSDDPVRPPVSSGAYAYDLVNVARQRTEQNSLLNWTERVVRMRKELPEIGRGEWTILDTNPEVLAVHYSWNGCQSIFVHNLSDRRIESELPVKDLFDEGSLLVCVLTHEKYTSGPKVVPLVLEPYGYRWLRLNGLDGALASD